MSGYSYGNPYHPQPPPIYVHIHTHATAPPQGQPTYTGYPAPSQPYQSYQQPGFNYQAQPPSATSHPAPSYSSVPTVTHSNLPTIEWVPTTKWGADKLADRAVVAGYEGWDHSPLWVIRARFKKDLIPGKLAIKHHAAYVPWGGVENPVHDIEVCCAHPGTIRWVESRNGSCPPNAVVAGHTVSGEPLYAGRAREQGSLTPGKIHPSHRTMYMSFGGKEIPHKVYEVLCRA